MDLVAAEYKSKTRWRVDVHQEPGVVHKNPRAMTGHIFSPPL